MVARTLRIRLRNWWRRIRNRCGICGEKRMEPNWNDVHSLGPYCRPCNKGMAFSQLYGMSNERALAALTVHRAMERANSRDGGTK